MLCLILLFAGAVKYEDFHHVKYVRTIDGDTIVVDIPGEKKLFGYHREVRLAGIDTPERHDKRFRVRFLAYYAKNVVRQRLERAKRIDLVDTGREKYDRILARVIVDGQDICALLLRRKLAHPYGGGTKNNNW